MIRSRSSRFSRQLSNFTEKTYENDEYKSTTLTEIRKSFLQLPKPDDKTGLLGRFMKYFPLVLPPWLFRRRIEQQILYSGTELKSGFIEEYSLHVLVEALFLSVTCQPLFTDVLYRDKEFNVWYSAFVSFFILTVVIQVSSLIINILWICAIVQLQESACQKWMAERVDPLQASGVLHVASFFLYASCILMWPLVMYPFPHGLIIVATPLVTMVLFMWRDGPLLGYIIKLASPLLMMTVNPSDVQVRELAVQEMKLITTSYAHVIKTGVTVTGRDGDGRPPARTVSGVMKPMSPTSYQLLSLLEATGLCHHADVLQDEGVTLDIIQDLTAEDFVRMEFSIGDKRRLLKGVRDQRGSVGSLGVGTMMSTSSFVYSDYLSFSDGEVKVSSSV